MKLRPVTEKDLARELWKVVAALRAAKEVNDPRQWHKLTRAACRLIDKVSRALATGARLAPDQQARAARAMSAIIDNEREIIRAYIPDDAIVADLHRQLKGVASELNAEELRPSHAADVLRDAGAIICSLRATELASAAIRDGVVRVVGGVLIVGANAACTIAAGVSGALSLIVLSLGADFSAPLGARIVRDGLNDIREGRQIRLTDSRLAELREQSRKFRLRK